MYRTSKRGCRLAAGAAGLGLACWKDTFCSREGMGACNTEFFCRRPQALLELLLVNGRKKWTFDPKNASVHFVHCKKIHRSTMFGAAPSLAQCKQNTALHVFVALIFLGDPAFAFFVTA